MSNDTQSPTPEADLTVTPVELTSLLMSAIPAGVPVFIEGPPGVGKSAIVADVSRQLDRRLHDIRVTLLDPVDLRGLPTVQDGRTRWAAPDFWPSQPGETLFLDELSAAPPSVQAACYQLVLNRQVGEYRLPDNTAIVAAGNRQTDRAVAFQISSALESRFIWVTLAPDVDQWARWAINAGLSPVTINFVRQRRTLFSTFDPKRKGRGFPCPRTWEMLDRTMKALPSDTPDALRLKAGAGAVGQGAAIEYMAWLKVWKSLPPIETIIRSPQSAPVPADPAVLYALCGSLAHIAKPERADAIVTYGQRLPPEFSTLMMSDSLIRCPDIMQTAAYVRWAADNTAFTC